MLLNDRYLRKKYKDPITGGDFQLLSGASVQANAGVPGGQVPGPGGAGRGALARVAATGQLGTGRGTGIGTSVGTGAGTARHRHGAGASVGRTGAAGAAGGFGLGSGVGAGAGGTVPGGIMGVTSTSTRISMRLYNGRGVYNEWTFVAVQRTLNAGAGGEGRGHAGRTRRTRRRGGWTRCVRHPGAVARSATRHDVRVASAPQQRPDRAASAANAVSGTPA